jgi:hypothetical protein
MSIENGGKREKSAKRAKRAHKKGVDDAPRVNDQQAESERKRETFLEVLRKTSNVRLACMAANLSRGLVYQWRDDMPEFRDAWKEARAHACDILEMEAWRRATRESNPSDTLLIFLLKAHRPRKFRENLRHEITGKAGGAIAVNVSMENALLKVYGDED